MSVRLQIEIMHIFSLFEHKQKVVLVLVDPFFSAYLLNYIVFVPLHSYLTSSWLNILSCVLNVTCVIVCQ